LRKLVLVAALVLMAGGAQATLFDRGEGFIYDDVLDITWAQAGNINGFDTWDNQMAWVADYTQSHSLYGVIDDWRLPTSLQPDPSCGIQIAGPPASSYGSGCTGGEMAHLVNVDSNQYDTGAGTFATAVSPLINNGYWTGTHWLASPNQAVSNGYGSGGWTSLPRDETDLLAALAVRDGDIAIIPEPSTGLLVVLGLTGLAAKGRRRNRS
jgi:hypothetical protein